jgi:tetratricopeptide (TPR) repeat protein
MAENREKALREAERLLRQGKAQPALEALRKIADRASRDPAVLNRIGDILAMHGRLPEALVYYQKIAEQFAKSGFYPKAIAIYKKILRKDPDRVETLIHMGRMYLQQKLPGEAKGYLLRAGEQLLQQQEYGKAREIFQSLVDSEPNDPRHRVRVAETLAAEGETEKAGNELIALSENLKGADQSEQLEQVCRRAAELLPGRLEPVIGLLSSFRARGLRQDAIEFATEQVERIGADPVLCGELAVLYEEEGRTDEALDLLNTTALHDVPVDALERFFRSRIDKGGAYETWGRLDVRLREWKESEGTDRLAGVLDRLAGLEEEGHVPALERLVEIQDGRGDQANLKILERLAGAYRARSMHTEAESIEKKIAKIGPAKAEEPPKEEEPVEEQTATEEAVPQEIEEQEEESGLPIEIEAPAVPLNRTDEEFASGRFTQAEILEKYGLLSKAISQLKEVAERFPGHVEAQERLARLLREEGQTGPLQEVLLRLAIARRAAGDSEAAKDAVMQAREISQLNEETSSMLRDLELLDGEPVEQAAVPDEPPEPPAEPEIPVPEVPEEASEEEPEEEIVIDFDADVEAPAAAAEDLEEIRFYLDQGMHEEAGNRLRELRARGIAGEDLDALEARIASPGEPVAEPQVETRLDDDDLSELTAALESELFVDKEEPAATPESGQEQSLEEVFAAFKEHVREEVEGDDFRTHYDLGIAYMEMGLIDEAISEFETSSGDASLRRDSCVMMAMCHKQKGVLPDAVACYRLALETPAEDRDADHGVQYDLAEVLLQQGDLVEALNLFRAVLADDPTFRDVQNRVSELESDRNS